jgi:hypothetical protein
MNYELRTVQALSWLILSEFSGSVSYNYHTEGFR